MTDDATAPGADLVQSDAGPVTVEGIISDLSGLTEPGQDAQTREEIRDVTQLVSEAHQRGLLESGVRELRARDAAEAFVGSVIFASPLLVEDGIFDIATHLFEFTVSGAPVFLLANTVFVVAMTYALVEWTGRNKEEADLLFGVFPTRVLMILVVSFLVAALLMTVWGRVGDWRPPAEALARINVIWTVGSLGAALGDILSEKERSPVATQAQDSAPPAPSGNDAEGDAAAAPSTAGSEELTDSAFIVELTQQFDELESAVETPEERREIQRLRHQTIQAALDDVFGTPIQKYTTRDIAEAFVGSIFFSIPFLVEDGVFDVADYFLSFQLGAFPFFFVVNALFVLLMISALVYWAGPQDVRMSRPILGIVPRRLIGIAVVSFLTAAMLMTMWGRVENWQEPVVALARISVVWTVASFGAALGDILPGESSGADINDDLAALGDLTGDGGEGTDAGP